MNEVEIAWVAGLLEGEGCFAIKKKSINVSCSMTDEDTIIRLHDTTEYGHMNGPYHHDKKKTTWTWEISGRADVVNLIVAVRPFMGERRTAKIDEMLDWNLANPLGRPRKDAAKHGSLGMYSNHDCRCDECVEAWNTYQRERYADNMESEREYRRTRYWEDPEKARRQATERARRGRMKRNKVEE